ncbi:MAG: hypothetical protein JO170_24110 [Verrucomicrobia bacterium]|nr:hypothetical protein [Verrucomicrobiota bacterium]
MSDTPIVLPADSQPVVNPGLDPTITSPAECAKLDKSFADFWREQDAASEAKPEPATSAPSAPEPPVQTAKEPEATAPEVPAPTSKRGRKPAEGRHGVDEVFDSLGDHLEPKPEAPSAEGDKLDKYQIHPNASEAHKSQWRELRDHAKAFREEARLAKAELDALKQALKESGFEDTTTLPSQVQALRQQAQNGSPEVAKELADFRAADRYWTLTRSHTFNRDHMTPLNTKVNSWLNRLIPY